MKANVRSPFHIYVNDTNLTKAIIDLYIYTGTKVGTIPSITYTVESTAYNNSVTFEIAELIKDYIDITFNGTYTSQLVFCNYRVTKYISNVAQTPEAIVQLECFDGYGYFEDSVNPLNSSDLLQSNTVIYKLDDAPVRIPIFADANKTVTFYSKGVQIYTQNITASTSTSTQINYVSNATNGVDSYKERVLADGGTFEDSSCLQSFLNSLIVYDVDKIYIVGATTKIVTVENITECKHTPYKLTFVNKFGALQDLWFFKRSNLSLQTNEEKYKSNILSNGSYSISAHQNRILNKQGAEKTTLNTGFYAEEYNEVFRQLMLSEKVWIEIDNKTLPINITSSSFSFKTQLNDKLISYTIEVDFAFDKINNIR